MEVLTDHNNLRYFQTTKKLTPRQGRWSQELSQYDFEILHRPGNTNPADGFSRRPDYMTDKIDAASLMLPTLQRKLMVAAVSPRPLPDFNAVGDADPSYLVIEEDSDEESDQESKVEEALGADEDFGEGSDLVEDGKLHLSSRIAAATASSADISRGLLDLPEDLLTLVKRTQEKDAWVLEGLWKDHTVEERGVARRPWAEDATGLLRFEGAAYVPKDESLRMEIITSYHDEPYTGGHLGFLNTLHNIRRNFFWPTMRKETFEHCRDCDICQRSKPTRHKPFGMLTQPAQPARVMKEFSMDFITGLPPVQHRGNVVDMILVVVDRMSKYAFYFSCNTEMSAEELADLWVERLGDFGAPDGIVSDRGSLFTSKFWAAWCYAMKVRRRLSTAFHPQTDGQTERQNQNLEHYLRCYVNERMDDWPLWLAAAQSVYNHKVHTSTGKSPFETVFGRSGHDLVTQELGEPPEEVAAVEWRVTELQVIREECTKLLQDARAAQAKYANAQRLPQLFEVGEKVLLSAKNIKTKRLKKKLDFKWLGPFTVMERVGTQAYKLDLPLQYPIHDVFHVSLLERYRQRPGAEPPEPQEIEGNLEFNVERILDTRMAGRRREFKVRWEGWAPAHDSWEPEENLKNSPEALKDFWSSVEQIEAGKKQLPSGSGTAPPRRGRGRPPGKNKKI